MVQPSHSYGMSHAIWDHTVLPATQQRRTHPALTPAEAGTRFIDHWMNGWVGESICEWIPCSKKLRVPAGNRTQYLRISEPVSQPLDKHAFTFMWEERQTWWGDERSTVTFVCQNCSRFRRSNNRFSRRSSDQWFVTASMQGSIQEGGFKWFNLPPSQFECKKIDTFPVEILHIKQRKEWFWIWIRLKLINDQ